MSTKHNYKDYYNKANKSLLKNKIDDAIIYYKQSLELKDNNTTCLKELASLYERTNKFYEAIECHKKIFLLENNENNKCILQNQIGVCYSNLKMYSKAIEHFENVLQINNTIPDVYNNIAFCYLQMKNYKLSETNYYKSLRIKKNNTVYKALGDLYFYLKKYDISIECYKKIDNFKDNSMVKYNSSFPYLAKQNFVDGYNLYENRLAFNDISAQTNEKQRVEIPQIKDWDGNAHCDSLLVIYEQGIGDNIQHYRFIIELSELYPNMKISYFCKNIVSHLFKEYDNIHIIQNVNIFDYNYKIFIMSLPYILNVTSISPNTINYINVDHGKIEYWKNEFTSFKKYRIGITYNGLLSSIIEKNIPLSEFTMFSDNNIELICIHKLNEIKDEDKNNLKDYIKFIDIDNDKPFQDTVAVLHNIDLLITIDTFIVHLAGILNIKTFLLLGYVSDWRWFNDNICHWYNSVEIFRLTENIEFKNILMNVKEKVDILFR